MVPYIIILYTSENHKNNSLFYWLYQIRCPFLKFIWKTYTHTHRHRERDVREERVMSLGF